MRSSAYINNSKADYSVIIPIGLLSISSIFLGSLSTDSLRSGYFSAYTQLDFINSSFLYALNISLVYFIISNQKSTRAYLFFFSRDYIRSSILFLRNLLFKMVHTILEQTIFKSGLKSIIPNYKMEIERSIHLSRCNIESTLIKSLWELIFSVTILALFSVFYLM